MSTRWDLLVDDWGQVEHFRVVCSDVVLEVLPVTLQLESVSSAVRSDRDYELVRDVGECLNVSRQCCNDYQVVLLGVRHHVACAFGVRVVGLVAKQALSDSEFSRDRVEANLLRWERSVHIVRHHLHGFVNDGVAITDIREVGVRLESRNVDFLAPDKHLILDHRS